MTPSGMTIGPLAACTGGVAGAMIGAVAGTTAGLTATGATIGVVAGTTVTGVTVVIATGGKASFGSTGVVDTTAGCACPWAAVYAWRTYIDQDKTVNTI